MRTFILLILIGLATSCGEAAKECSYNGEKVECSALEGNGRQVSAQGQAIAKGTYTFDGETLEFNNLIVLQQTNPNCEVISGGPHRFQIERYVDRLELISENADEDEEVAVFNRIQNYEGLANIAGYYEVEITPAVARDLESMTMDLKVNGEVDLAISCK